MQDDNTDQEFRIDGRNRVSGTNPLVGNSNNFFIYAVADSTGTFTTVDLALTTPATYTASATPATIASINFNLPTATPAGIGPRPSVLACATACTAAVSAAACCKRLFNTRLANANNRAFNALLETIDGYMASDGKEGFYYAMFDSEFRIVMAYYSRFVDRAAAHGASYIFTHNNTISGRTFGAFPRQYAFTGTIGTDISKGGAPTPHNNRELSHTAGEPIRTWFRNVIPGI